MTEVSRITACLKVTAEFYDPEATEETVRACIEQDLEDAGYEVEVSPFGNWTNVKTKLPESSGKYLVCANGMLAGQPVNVKTAWFLTSLKDNCQFKYEMQDEPDRPGFYNGDGEGDWIENGVTYWMPLPEPPKEET